MSVGILTESNYDDLSPRLQLLRDAGYPVYVSPDGYTIALGTPDLSPGMHRISVVIEGPVGLVEFPAIGVTALPQDAPGEMQEVVARFARFPDGVRGFHVAAVDFTNVGRWNLILHIPSEDGFTDIGIALDIPLDTAAPLRRRYRPSLSQPHPHRCRQHRRSLHRRDPPIPASTSSPWPTRSKPANRSSSSSPPPASAPTPSAAPRPKSSPNSEPSTETPPLRPHRPLRKPRTGPPRRRTHRNPHPRRMGPPHRRMDLRSQRRRHSHRPLRAFAPLPEVEAALASSWRASADPITPARAKSVIPALRAGSRPPAGKTRS